MALKELKEKRFEIGKTLETLRLKHSAERANEHAGWESAEARSAYMKADEEYTAISTQLETATTAEEEGRLMAQRAAQVEQHRIGSGLPTGGESRITTQTAPSFRTQELAFEAWGRFKRPETISDEMRAAQRSFGAMDPSEFTFRMPGIGYMGRGQDLSRHAMQRVQSESRAAMGSSTDVLGGYTIPEGFVMNLEYAMRAFGGVRNVADVIRTETAQPLPWPTIADTTAGSSDPAYGGSLINVGELLGENVSTSLQGTPPVMGAMILGAQKFSSKLIQISTELLRDSAFNLATYIGRIIGERLARMMAQKFATGTGAGIVPRGILNAVPTAPAAGALGTGYTTASSAGVTFDDLSNLIFSVDPAYRASPGAGFCLHDKYVGMIRLLKDGVGRYLWTAGSVTTGLEPRIWDYPYQVAQEYPYNLSGNVLDSTVSTGIGATTYLGKLITFGDHSKYKIREVGTVRMKRLVERFAEYDQDGFIGYMEADGDLLDAGTHPIGALALHP